MSEPTAEQRADILYRQFEEWGECPRGCIAAEIRAAEAAAYRRGQEEMRGRCCAVVGAFAHRPSSWLQALNRIATLPLTEEKTCTE